MATPVRPYSSLATRHSPLATRYSLLVTHRSSLIAHRLVGAGEDAPALRRAATEDADGRLRGVRGGLVERQVADRGFRLVLDLIFAGAVATPPGVKEAAVVDLLLELII